ncbi:MAG: NUDIX hydrolase [Gammaproteobacteria bacterium]|nr:NUDIX hydrolase [Gammaproteobacteria bacterium]MDH5488127.1 NUDIX hydrolase [Gammaproteobacteria bacterium]
MPVPRTPALTTDIIIELKDRTDVPIVLIRRKNPPHGWALPGGFVDIGESLEQAAVREAGEETTLRVRLKLLLGCYSDPTRDPRHHTASVVYVAEAEGEPRAQDDAAGVAIFSPEALPSPLVFDHARILSDYLVWRQQGTRPLPENP